MELVNQTPFAVVVSRMDVDQSQLLAAVIVKATFDVNQRTGELTVASEQAPLVRQFLDTPFGTLHGEIFFKKKGVDLCVLGTVRRHAPVTRATVRVALGDRAWELRLYGDRRWQRAPSLGDAGLRLVPSAPEPFVEFPLGYGRAFGGETLVGEMPYGYPKNPKGRGFYQSPEEAEGQLLPNIEDARAPEQSEYRVEDEPPVAGFGPYPQFWALRAEAALKIDPERQRVSSISPLLFNHAHPDLVLDQLPRASSIVADGLSPERRLCAVPKPPVLIDLQLGAEQRSLEAPIDGLFWWADDNKLVVTQRVRFRYELRREELRVVTARPNLPLPKGDLQ